MGDRFSNFKEANQKVITGSTVKEVVKKKVRKTNDINVKDLDEDLFDYVDSTGLSMSAFVRKAMREKQERDS